MKKVPLPLLVLLLIVLAGRSSGQSYQTFRDEFAEISGWTGLRLGPLRMLPLLRLSDVGYDDNVYYRAREEGPVGDYTGTVSPEIKAGWLLGSSIILAASESPEYDFFLKERGLRTLTNSYSAASRILLFRGLALSGDFHSQRHLRRAYDEFDQQIEDTQRGFDASIFFETPRGTAIGLRGSSDEYRYANIGIQEAGAAYSGALDRRERTAAFEFYYRVFSQSFLFCTFGASDYEFADPDFTDRNARSYQTSIGLRFPVLGRARGTLALGYKKFIPEAGDRRVFSGVVADTDLSFRVGRVGLSLGCKRDNYFSYLETAYYYVEDRLRCGLTFAVLPFLRLEGAFQVGAWRYPDPQEVFYQGETYLVESRRDTNRVFSAGFGVRVAGNDWLSFSYNLYRRRSNAPGYDIDRNFIGAALAYDF
jgi:hypothetical protein